MTDTSGPGSVEDKFTAEARGIVLARVEHEWECDFTTFIEGPCNCNRVSIVDALIAAVRSSERARLATPPAAPASVAPVAEAHLVRELRAIVEEIVSERISTAKGVERFLAFYRAT